MTENVSPRASLLRVHIETAKEKPVIGIDDCGPWVVKWVEIACGRRMKFPVYATSEEGHALAEKAGGLINLVAPLCAECGLWETHAPDLGDIGVLRLSDHEVPVICMGFGFVAIRGEGPGIRQFRPRSLVKAWAVP